MAINSVMAHRRFRDALALLAGLALPYAFSPYDYWWLGLLSQVLLLHLWVSEPNRAWRYGWLYGAGAFTLGLSWLYVSIHEVGMAPALMAAGLTFLFGVFLGLFPACAGLLLRRFEGKGFVVLLAAAVASWTLLSWVRSWVFTGFPWLSPGAAYLDTPLAGFGPVFGSYGMEALSMTSAALLVYLWNKQAGGKTWAVAFLLVIWVSGALLMQVNWTQPVGKPLTVSLVQGNVDQVDKWKKDIRQMTMQRYGQLTESEWGRDLIIWPETAIPAFLHTVEKTYMQVLSDKAKESKSTLFFGIPVMDRDSNYYNSVISLGENEGEYRKRHLVPFGEFLPFAFLLRPVIDMMRIPMADFTSGTEEQALLKVKGMPIAIGVCYEDIFGAESVRYMGDSKVLVNVSNDAWFGDTAAPHQHHQMARLRALEAGRPMIRVSNTGLTGFVDEKGEMGATLPLFQQGVLRGTVQAMDGKTPYQKWQDWPVILLVMFLLLRVLRVSRRED